MEKEKKLGLIFDSLAEELNITNTMLDKAVTAYSALGRHIKTTNEEWDVSVYPQGSFELGTVVKPLKEDEQYDVDLVVLVNDPEFTAADLRGNVKALLESHGRYEGKIQDKKPCVRIQYADAAQFHMDVASAKNVNGKKGTDIEIAKFNGDITYYYDLSNPKGYANWFKSAMKYQEVLLEKRAFSKKAETEVEELELTKLRTPLQKVIQILKRHRDIFFAGKENSEDRPSSIIITTLCGLAYNDLSYINGDRSNVYIIIRELLERFSKYIKYEIGEGWKLSNPSYKKENFLNKWNGNPALKVAYDEWIYQVKIDILTNPEEFIDSNTDKFKEGIFESFGEGAGKAAFERYGIEFGKLKEDGKLKFNVTNASIGIDSNDKSYKKHTYFGGVCNE